ncbi:hypothetical protein GJAV_G00002190 [Gymnothorax javanicus]|nr:hypothetical protein GJAV_G00002190 [Gymnothorax javanicus]
MGRLKLYLVLLLSAQAFAQQGSDSGEDQSPMCLLASRYKNFKKYTYQYEAEVQNGVTGTANAKNGPKVACTVELEVPQSCSFVLRTLGCSVSEVSFIDAEGQPIYQPTASSDAFKAAMEKNPLKFSVGQDLDVSLFPESQEPGNILNVKRGIVSALIVPTPEQYGNVIMPTIHGRCKTSISINPSDVTLTRDLTGCKGFIPMPDYTSPLALVSGMSTPLSKLIGSSQSCSYQFDNKRKHMTATTCTEKHIFLPFSHKDEYGITSHVKQTLTFRKSDKINNRNFDYETANERVLNMENAEDKSPIQSKDSMLDTLRELKGLSQTQQGQQRAALFQKLVSQLRGLSNDTLGPAVAEMMEVSKLLTWQALPQCGTPECISAILQVLRNFAAGALEVDAVAYAVGFLRWPDARRVRDMLSMAQNRQTKAVMYGLSNTVRRFYDENRVITPEVMQVSEFMTLMLSGDCTGDEDRTFLTLRVIGNMGAVMDAASPELKSTILRCSQESAASPAVQQAAIQALRQMEVDEETSFSLGQIFKDAGNPVQKRIAAYLIMMKKPELALPRVEDVLKTEQDQEITSFVVSHIANMLKGEDSKIDYLRTQFQDILDMVQVYQDRSHNYKMETPSQMPFQASVESNMIYDSNGLHAQRSYARYHPEGFWV